MQVRILSESDFINAAAYLHADIGIPTGPSFRLKFQHRELTAWGCDHHHEPVGILLLSSKGHIICFHIKEEWRGKGPESQLFQEARRLCLERLGLREMTVNARRPQLPMYRYLGFRPRDTSRPLPDSSPAAGPDFMVYPLYFTLAWSANQAASSNAGAVSYARTDTAVSFPLAPGQPNDSRRKLLLAWSIGGGSVALLALIWTFLLTISVLHMAKRIAAIEPGLTYEEAEELLREQEQNTPPSHDNGQGGYYEYRYNYWYGDDYGYEDYYEYEDYYDYGSYPDEDPYVYGSYPYENPYGDGSYPYENYYGYGDYNSEDPYGYGSYPYEDPYGYGDYSSEEDYAYGDYAYEDTFEDYRAYEYFNKFNYNEDGAYSDSDSASNSVLPEDTPLPGNNEYIYAYVDENVSYQIQEEEYLEYYSTDAEYIDFAVYYPQLTGLSNGLEEQVNKLIRDCAMETADALYLNPSASTRNFLTAQESVYCASFVNYDITYMDDNFISIIFQEDYYWGSVYGEYSDFYTLNIDLRTGAVYEIADFIQVDGDFTEVWFTQLASYNLDTEPLFQLELPLYDEMLRSGEVVEDRYYTYFFVADDGIHMGVTFHYTGEDYFGRGYASAPYPMEQLISYAKEECELWNLITVVTR